MPEDQPKLPRRTFFDVARPGTVPTNATSKPVVVGHGVTQVDPMMRAGQDEESAPTTAPELPGDSEQLTTSGVNPNSIPLDAEEVPEVTLEQATEEDVEPGVPPVASEPAPEPESAQVAEEVPETPALPDAPTPEAATPVEEPARGPASHPPKLLTEHADGGETEKKARERRSTKHKIVIAVLLIFVVAAVAFDVYLLTEYLKLK